MTNNTDPAGLSSSPHPPTREQIAGHLVGIRLWTGDGSPALVIDRSLSAQIAYAVLALIQNGADR